MRTLRVALLLGAFTLPLRAQRLATSLAPGERVRLWQREEPTFFQGTIIERRGDSLLVDNGQYDGRMIRVDLTTLDSAQLRRRVSGGGYKQGSVIGGFTGVFLFALAVQTRVFLPKSPYADQNEYRAASLVFGGAASALAGALVGGTIGALHHRTVWESVALPRR